MQPAQFVLLFLVLVGNFAMFSHTSLSSSSIRSISPQSILRLPTPFLPWPHTHLNPPISCPPSPTHAHISSLPSFPYPPPPHTHTHTYTHTSQRSHSMYVSTNRVRKVVGVKEYSKKDEDCSQMSVFDFQEVYTIQQ